MEALEDAVPRTTAASYKNDQEREFFEACITGKADAVETLLKSNVEIDCTSGPRKSTALIQSARYGHANVAKLLLDAKANVNAEDEEGMTSLMMASAYGHEAAAKTLYDGRARTKNTNKAGWTALMFASEGAHAGIVNFLIHGVKKVKKEEKEAE